MSYLQVGSKVRWQWGEGSATGKIVERFEEKVSRRLKGSEVTRDASKDDPAFLIEQDDGDKVLKSESELERA
jgi:ABC-type taurine transport system ATPase subunit